MKKIYLERLVYKQKNYIALKFDNEASIANIIRTIEGRNWSKLKKLWYFEDTKETLPKLFKAFKNKAWLDITALKNLPPVIIKPVVIKIPKRALPENFVEKIEGKYSPNTIKSYKAMFAEFITYFNSKNIEDITPEDAKNFQNYLINEKKVSQSHQNQSINSIKFYYEHVLNKPDFVSFDRPKHTQTLPIVLTQDEIKEIFGKIKNIKHKCMLNLIYSGGLRISEVMNLKTKDIDSKQMLVNIEGVNGRKDRVTMLSEKVLTLLREYYLKYKPKNFLFEGKSGGISSTRGLEVVFKRALGKTGIKKEATVNSLRHSFATHLLEKGTDAKYVQNLLGHESTRSTQIYKQVSERGIGKIKSPFDDMDF